jgi:AAA ATPase-like protein
MDLLERSSLLEELSGVLAATAGGRVVLLAGEAGIGKSALVKRFTERQSADARFLAGGCDPMLTPRALGPLHDMARQTGGRLAELLDSGGDRGRLSSRRSWTRSRSRRRSGRLSWWRTCTGPTRRLWTCWCSWGGGWSALR